MEPALCRGLSMPTCRLNRVPAQTLAVHSNMRNSLHMLHNISSTVVWLSWSAVQDLGDDTDLWLLLWC